MGNQDRELARLENVVSMRCSEYEQYLLAHLQGWVPEEMLHEIAAAYRGAVREYREALHHCVDRHDVSHSDSRERQ